MQRRMIERMWEEEEAGDKKVVIPPVDSGRPPPADRMAIRLDAQEPARRKHHHATPYPAASPASDATDSHARLSLVLRTRNKRSSSRVRRSPYLQVGRDRRWRSPPVSLRERLHVDGGNPQETSEMHAKMD